MDYSQIFKAFVFSVRDCSIRRKFCRIIYVIHRTEIDDFVTAHFDAS